MVILGIWTIHLWHAFRITAVVYLINYDIWIKRSTFCTPSIHPLSMINFSYIFPYKWKIWTQTNHLFKWSKKSSIISGINFYFCGYEKKSNRIWLWSVTDTIWARQDESNGQITSYSAITWKSVDNYCMFLSFTNFWWVIATNRFQ